jgi:hypothetical protein
MPLFRERQQEFELVDQGMVPKGSVLQKEQK